MVQNQANTYCQVLIITVIPCRKSVSYGQFMREGWDFGLFIAQSFLITFFLFVGLTTLGNFIEFLIGLFIKVNVKTFQPLIVIYKA